MALRIFNIFQIHRAPECWGLFLGLRGVVLGGRSATGESQMNDWFAVPAATCGLCLHAACVGAKSARGLIVLLVQHGVRMPGSIFDLIMMKQARCDFVPKIAEQFLPEQVHISIMGTGLANASKQGFE